MTWPVARNSSTREPTFAIMSTVVRSSSADSIWLAMDRFVRFLRVLGAGLILARRLRHIGVAIILADHFPRLRDSLVGDLHAIGSHIGDNAGGLAADIDALVEPLGDAHGVRRRKSELPGCFFGPGRGGVG